MTSAARPFGGILDAAGLALIVAATVVFAVVRPVAVATAQRQATPTTAVTSRARATPRATVTPATTTSTLVSIPGGAVTPSTLPLHSREPSAHVSSVFPILSITGFSVALLMLVVQWFLTRPRREGGWTL